MLAVTMPSHSSDRLQPLDVGNFGPLKKHYNDAVSKVVREVNKGQLVKMNRFTCGAIIQEVYPIAFSQSNIQSGFDETGLWPLNANWPVEQNLPITAASDAAATTSASSSADPVSVSSSSSGPMAAAAALASVSHPVRSLPVTKKKQRLNPIGEDTRQGRIINLADRILKVAEYKDKKRKAAAGKKAAQLAKKQKKEDVEQPIRDLIIVNGLHNADTFPKTLTCDFLKDILTQLGLATSGLKDTLLERLHEALMPDESDESDADQDSPDFAEGENETEEESEEE